MSMCACVRTHTHTHTHTHIFFFQTGKNFVISMEIQMLEAHLRRKWITLRKNQSLWLYQGSVLMLFEQKYSRKNGEPNKEAQKLNCMFLKSYLGRKVQTHWSNY